MVTLVAGGGNVEDAGWGMREGRGKEVREKMAGRRGRRKRNGEKDRDEACPGAWESLSSGKDSKSLDG